MIQLKNPAQIASMRVGGKMLATILQLLAVKAEAGMTPKDLSKIASQELKVLGGKPAFLGVGSNPPFPDVICISVNDQVQHSIPSNIPLKDGDIVNLDFGVLYDNLITDAGISICIGGKPSADDKRLLLGTEQALMKAIDSLKAGVRVGDLSAVIEKVLRSHKLGIVRELVGHGVGFQLHEDPEIPNYGLAGLGPIIPAGATIAIEPITTLGSREIIFEPDGWTIRTADGSKSAQFEHTILVNDSGCEVLTLA